MRFFLAFLIIFSFITPVVFAQEELTLQEKKQEEPNTYGVRFNNETILYVTGKGDYPARKRAKLIEDKLLKLAKNRALDTKKIDFEHSGSSTFMYLDNVTVLSISEQDAKLMGKPRKQYAQAVGKVIVKNINDYREQRTFLKLLGAFFLAILASIIFLLLIRVLNGIYLRTYGHFKNQQDRLSEKTQIVSYGTVSFILEILKFFKALTLFVAFYFYMISIFKIFPDTRVYEKHLTARLTDFLAEFIEKTANYLPNLILIAFMLVAAYYLNRVIKYIFRRVETSKIIIQGFYPEWASSTSKIIRFLVIVFTFIFIFPLLPGSDSKAFQAISIFLGALVSLSSASAVANIIAGIVLTYTRAFLVGDIVKIGDTTGRIIEANLLVTRVYTPKNVSISIPNSLVLGSHIENYSIKRKTKKLILHVTITIGYDTNWKKVYKLMLEAADKTPDILKEPKPFVLQTSLENSYIAYELNVYTEKPERIIYIYSSLFENIQDCFNNAGVEIMSTQNISVRNGNKSTLPDKTE